MTKEQIEKEIAEMNEWMPISKIEERLGMPPTTLQKVLKGERKLPKKWVNKLEAYFVVNSVPVPEKNNHQKPLDATEVTDNEYGFDVTDKWLMVEKYTKYPKKSIPNGWSEQKTWQKEKDAADRKIRIAWQEFKKQNPY